MSQPGNPYQSPSTASARIVPDDRRISALAIFLGFVASLGISYLGGIAINVAVAATLLAQRASLEQVQATLEGPAIQVFSLLLGLGSTLIGGYLAGQVAGCRQTLHGGTVGVLSLVTGRLLSWLLLGTFSINSMNLYAIITFLSVVPMAMLGGWLASRRPWSVNERRNP